MPRFPMPDLRLISIRELVSMIDVGELESPNVQRSPWPAKKRLDFLNALVEHGIFGSIMLLDRRLPPGARDADPRYAIIDGTGRIDAVLRAFGMGVAASPASGPLFDLMRYRFVDRGKAGITNTRFAPRDALHGGNADRILDRLINPVGSGTPNALAIRHLERFLAFLDLRLPAYVVEQNPAAVFAAFEEFNAKGHFLCPNGYPECPGRYRPAGSFNREGLVATPGLSPSRHGNAVPFPCHDAIGTTAYASIFAGTDLECRVSLVPRAIVDALAVNRRKLNAYIDAVLERAELVLGLPPAGMFNPGYVRSAADELAGCLVGVVQDDGFYDGAVLDRMQSILLDLIPTLNRAAASMASPPKPLLVMTLRHGGVFIDRDVTIGRVLCRAGVFIRDDEREPERKRIVDHELAHAYFRANKARLIDCPWIEEGLAEWCSGYRAGSFRVKTSFAFYEFQQVFTPLPLDAVRAVADRWLRGDVPVSYWCRMVKNRAVPAIQP